MEEPIEELIGWYPMLFPENGKRAFDMVPMWSNDDGTGHHGSASVDDLLAWIGEEIRCSEMRWEVNATSHPRTVCWGTFDHRRGGWEHAVSGDTLFEALENAVREIARQQA